MPSNSKSKTAPGTDPSTATSRSKTDSATLLNRINLAEASGLSVVDSWFSTSTATAKSNGHQEPERPLQGHEEFAGLGATSYYADRQGLGLTNGGGGAELEGIRKMLLGPRHASAKRGDSVSGPQKRARHVPANESDDEDDEGRAAMIASKKKKKKQDPESKEAASNTKDAVSRMKDVDDGDGDDDDDSDEKAGRSKALPSRHKSYLDDLLSSRQGKKNKKKKKAST